MTRKSKTGETAGQGVKFIGVGVAATAVDFCVYVGLLVFGLGSAPSKFAAAVAGIATSYAGNRFITFKSAETARNNVLAFVGLYGLTLLANVWINEVMLSVLPESVFRIALAFGVATGASAALNFIGLKFVVFKR